MDLSYLYKAWDIHSQASTFAPSEDKLNPAGRIGKGGPREYPHTRMGVHEDKLDLKKGEEERRNSTNIDSFSIKNGMMFI
jgi:hypothetical protein